MSKKLFRTDNTYAETRIKQLFPDKAVWDAIEKSLSKCIKTASELNNSNWNLNFSENFLRFNCGNRYILNINPMRIRVMCARETFLSLGETYINDFLKKFSLYKEDMNLIKARGLNPKTYIELCNFPQDALWNRSVQFEIPIEEWVNFREKLMQSILDFAQDSIINSTIMTNMKNAHSPAIVKMIGKDMGENLKQPIYSADEFENEKIKKFKHLLEYFVAHLEYCVNGENLRGYETYIKRLVETNSFFMSGQGYK